jgi:hypothetical protein
MSLMLEAPKVELKLQPVLKTLVYAALAGEFLRNTGMTDNDQLNAVQQAVAEGLVERVVVTGRRPDNGVEIFTLTMKPPAPGETLHLGLEAGKSIAETVDVALAAGIKHAADLLKRQGLKPEYLVGWSARVRANPALGVDAIKRLNIRAEALPTPPPPMPAAMPTYQPLYTPPPAPPLTERYAHTVNTYTGPPYIPPTQVYKPVVTVKPIADPNISFSWETSVLKR